MGQILHGSARTTGAIRRAIQYSQASLRVLAMRHGINPKTVAKWRKRCSTADRRTGPTTPKSTALSVEQEAIVIAFRKHTLLPFDDCLYALQATIPRLTHSSLHRCLERHGISRLPEVEVDKPGRKKFDSYPIGFFHIYLAEVRTAEGNLHLFVGIDRTSKFAVVELVEKADMQAAASFLQALVAAVPYRIHTVLTDNGIQFADLLCFRGGRDRKAWTARPGKESVDLLFSVESGKNGRPKPRVDIWIVAVNSAIDPENLILGRAISGVRMRKVVHNFQSNRGKRHFPGCGM